MRVEKGQRCLQSEEWLSSGPLSLGSSPKSGEGCFGTYFLWTDFAALLRGEGKKSLNLACNLPIHRWNNSLTGADVRRRLPCEGALWEAGNPVRTPYFGIAERSSTSRANAPTLTPTSERHPADEEEVDCIGGFAFCIEATESLNLVTTFFLRQPVNFDNSQEMQVWLMKFKELDLRLVK